MLFKLAYLVYFGIRNDDLRFQREYHGLDGNGAYQYLVYKFIEYITTKNQAIEDHIKYCTTEMISHFSYFQ